MQTKNVEMNCLCIIRYQGMKTSFGPALKEWITLDSVFNFLPKGFHSLVLAKKNLLPDPLAPPFGRLGAIQGAC